MPRPLVDVDAVAPSSFCLTDEVDAMSSDWHVHRRHQLLYAARGTLHLEVADAQWLLPSQRAAWIAGGVSHRVQAARPVELCTVYLDPCLNVQVLEGACRVFVLPAFAREMLLYSSRWGPMREAADPVAESFFNALVHLLPEWTSEPREWRLPRAKTPELEHAMAFTVANLGKSPSLAEVAKAAGLSQRTLSRRFEEETGSSWRRFLLTARMLRAMELLATDGAHVTQTAFAVGFESPAAFTHAFTTFTGERPRDFRERVAQVAQSSRSGATPRRRAR